MTFLCLNELCDLVVSVLPLGDVVISCSVWSLLRGGPPVTFFRVCDCLLFKRSLNVCLCCSCYFGWEAARRWPCFLFLCIFVKMYCRLLSFQFSYFGRRLLSLCSYVIMSVLLSYWFRVHCLLKLFDARAALTRHDSNWDKCLTLARLRDKSLWVRESATLSPWVKESRGAALTTH